jgi:hypothetical protein
MWQRFQLRIFIIWRDIFSPRIIPSIRQKISLFLFDSAELLEGTKKTGIHFPVVMVSRGTGIDETTGPVSVLEYDRRDEEVGHLRAQPREPGLAAHADHRGRTAAVPLWSLPRYFR